MLNQTKYLKCPMPEGAFYVYPPRRGDRQRHAGGKGDRDGEDSFPSCSPPEGRGSSARLGFRTRTESAYILCNLEQGYSKDSCSGRHPAFSAAHWAERIAVDVILRVKRAGEERHFGKPGKTERPSAYPYPSPSRPLKGGASSACSRSVVYEIQAGAPFRACLCTASSSTPSPPLLFLIVYGWWHALSSFALAEPSELALARFVTAPLAVAALLAVINLPFFRRDGGALGLRGRRFGLVGRPSRSLSAFPFGRSARCRDPLSVS